MNVACGMPLKVLAGRALSWTLSRVKLNTATVRGGGQAWLLSYFFSLRN